MIDPKDETPSDGELSERLADEDPRKPYEPPRVMKKRTVARATLFSPMGNTMTGTGSTGIL